MFFFFNFLRNCRRVAAEKIWQFFNGICHTAEGDRRCFGWQHWGCLGYVPGPNLHAGLNVFWCLLYLWWPGRVDEYVWDNINCSVSVKTDYYRLVIHLRQLRKSLTWKTTRVRTEHRLHSLHSSNISRLEGPVQTNLAT